MMAMEVFGRHTELRALSDVIDQAEERGGAIVVRGEAGIGKSTLLDAVADHARRAGHHVLRATGTEAEARMPFAGLHQLLSPLLDDAEKLPALQRRVLSSAFGAEDAPSPEPFLIALAALNLLTETSARRPLAILVDDVQWLDRPSHEALAFLARRIGSDPIVIVAGIRDGHTGPLVAARLPELLLGGLDDQTSLEILKVTAADLSAADRMSILRQANGNPLALVELPAGWRLARNPVVESLPTYVPLSARLEKAFGGRIMELPSPTRDALLIASVADENAVSEILAAASVLSGHAVTVDVLDAAAAAGLIRFDEVNLFFRHPLVRSGVLQTESVRRRLDANAALAEVLVDQPYRRTWHRAQAIVGPDDEVADELEAHHVVSIRRGSVAAAISALERSAQLTSDSGTRGRRLLLAAEHAFGLGRADMVDQLLALAGANALSELDRARMELFGEIFHDGVPGDATRVFELCDTAQRSAQAGDKDLALNLLLGAALRCWWADTGPVARAQVVAVAERLEDVEDDPRYVATLGLAETVLRSVRVTELLSRVAVDSVTDPAAMRLLGMAAMAIGSPVASLEFLDRAEAKLREQGRLGLLSHVLNMGQVSRVELGDWERAEAAAAEGGRLAHETGQLIWNSGTLAYRAVTAALRGDNATAQQLADEAEETARARGLNCVLSVVQRARGTGWLAAGEYVRAYEGLRRMFDTQDPCHHSTASFHGVMDFAEAAVRADRVHEARSVIAELEELTSRTASTTLRVQLSYARAVLAPDDQAEALFVAALSQGLTDWPWPQARLQLAYGCWLRRHRRVAESRVPLRSALMRFDLIGAQSWAGQARAELRAAGERTSVEEPSALNLLSTQELQIARLAAEGLSNREIGRRLYLSPRTIGSHLYRIFPKLAITSRVQLADRLEAV
ncbi:ATP-binding protein [Streptomyces sp. NBC_00271]|uniref:ATP-binding protein n=1 Tax=Streptomyces sp. NBC_00271 TaxID=2975697 RepID=UPI002E2ABC73|nr:AAA family ATPase [Streptomyces sp. NBC_00271]